MLADRVWPGSLELYRLRAELTQRLIRDKGFTTIAAEADWPDAYRINRDLRGTTSDRSAADALGDFRRFPQWMWRDTDVPALVDWLRRHDDAIHDPARKVGFYELDLYSLHASMAAVIGYLDARDPAAAQRARDLDLRDTHMADTLDAIAGHLAHRGADAGKIVVWGAQLARRRLRGHGAPRGAIS